MTIINRFSGPYALGCRNGAKFNDPKKTKPIKMRIGVHTGSVVVGTWGNDLRVEFKAVGDMVNLAYCLSEMGHKVLLVDGDPQGR
jgi:class 3 adenylate cyclase